MIRDGKKLPADIMRKIPGVIAKIAEDKDVVALYAFGSLADGNFKPLNDLDFVTFFLILSINRNDLKRVSI